MASSSTAASTSYANNNYYVYDIFINHRGPDCKKPFATNLYNSLCKRGLKVFLDVEELQEGDRLTSQIEGAIRTASVHIAIFSPRYAESTWCLRELVLMLESKATIIPVFYGVHPSELRWTQGENGLMRMLPWFLCILLCTRQENGVYARALRKLQGKKTFDSRSGQEKPRYDPEIIGKWKKALSDVADISGFDMETYNGDEQELLEQLVEGVLKKVPRKLHVSKYPIALDQKVEDFERKMRLQQQSGQTRVIGIVGLGGVGKTTLAKKIYNGQISNYNRCCFLSDVRDKSLISLQNMLLQNMLLKDLAQWNEQLNNTDQGIEMLRKYLSSSKALIVLDDVDHIRQMDALLLPAKDALHSGSLILVTSRNKDVLKSSGIEESSIYKLTGLDRQDSEELFCSHAFQQSNPVVGFEKVVNEFLDACDGLPLSLMVLGAHLHGKSDLKYWEAQLRKISKALPTDIQRRLKISYDGLDEEEKHIFLDIACFFTGEDRDTAIRIWDGSGWEGELGFRNLENKCIVEVDGKNQITMHDHLRDLGRDLAEKEPPDCRRRLWRPDDNLINLSNQSPVRGISMKNGSEWPLQSTAMRSLQLIRAEGHSVQSIFSVAQTPQPIWLCWNKCPYPSLPSWTPMENLRVLQIEGIEFETIWTEESQAPLQIRELNIDSRVLNVPKTIAKLIHLEKFFLHHTIHGSVGLKTLPDEFCHLQSLKHLLLRDCSEIESLPDSFGNLTSLQTIQLSSCSHLQSLPDSLGNLTSLQTIDLSGCSHLQRLPDSLGNLTSLQTIHLSGCSHLQRLPDSLGNLTSLQTIHLSDCSHLQRLPDSLGYLTSLQTIDLFGCSHLQRLPDSFDNLTNLQKIYLSHCSHLQRLLDSFSNFTQMRKLQIKEMNNLEVLKIEDCQRSDLPVKKDGGEIETLSNSRDASEVSYSEDVCLNLEHVKIKDCNGLVEIEALPTTLITLKLSGCGALMKVGGLSGLSKVRTLDISWCIELEELPSIETLVSLEEFRAFNCVKLKSIQGLEHLTKLQKLNVNWCMELEELPGIETLVSLEELCAFNCAKLKSIHGLDQLTKLRVMNISGSIELEELPSFETLVSLEELCAFNCVKLKSVQGLEPLTKLRTLNINGCMELQKLPSIETLVSLQELSAFNCVKLKSIQGLEHLTELLTLNIDGCMELEELPCIEKLVSLERLAARRCGKLKSIQGLAQLTELQLLDVRECSELEDLPGVEYLEWLETLYASGCPKLQWGGEVVERLHERLKEGFII